MTLGYKEGPGRYLGPSGMQLRGLFAAAKAFVASARSIFLGLALRAQGC